MNLDRAQGDSSPWWRLEQSGKGDKCVSLLYQEKRQVISVSEAGLDKQRFNFIGKKQSELLNT